MQILISWRNFLVRYKYLYYLLELFILIISLEIVGKDFKWPATMSVSTRQDVFHFATYEGKESDIAREYANNKIAFHTLLENGEFEGHEKDWVLICYGKVLEYG